MSEVAVQASFNSGEWSPKLYARVDMQKYRSGAALLENFFVDYRGGASTRPGTRYIIQAYDSANPVRLIPFQVSFATGYILEFGNGYIRFMFEGAPVTETPLAISAASQANPCVLTIVGNTFIPGDWIAVATVGGMTQLNGRYFRVQAVSGDDVTIGDLNGVDIDSLAYSAYTGGGTAARIYTIPSPYTSADDLRLIKFAQNINQMVLCHPNHTPYILTLVTATNWTLIPIDVGASISSPTGVGVTTTVGAGSANYSYVVTAIDANGQESNPSTPGNLASVLDIAATAGSNTIAWSAPAGAVAYNVYKSTVRYGAAVPAGAQYGFIGTSRSSPFIDTNIAADFSLTPPISYDPFTGFSVASVAVTAPGAYTTVPAVSFIGASTTPATATARLGAQSVTIASGGFGYSVGEYVIFPYGLVLYILTLGFGGSVASFLVINGGSITSGSVPTNPFGHAPAGGGTGFSINATWGVVAVIVTNGGSGYIAPPTVGFSSGAATATATLGSGVTINPTVPGFVQQRLILAAPVLNPSTFYMSKPGQYFNFDTSNPITAGDSITSTLVSGTLNTIKSVLGSASGMIILTDRASWVANGGTQGSAITPLSIVANPQSYIGANDVPPIVANYDILFVQAKGSAVRDMSYNIYYNVFTGSDISIVASHLFYGFTIEEWAWAEQPYYLAQAIRNDGVILSLTFLKEQEFIGWTHYTTEGGTYESIATVTEILDDDTSVDAVYIIDRRTVNGNLVQYIERFAERNFPNGVEDAWCVDAGLQYSGAPATSFTGAEHLAGLTVTGLADGEIITPFVMPVDGFFTLPTAASLVTIGLGYTCDLQTLPLDLGEPSAQGKVKKITSVDVRVADTLGLKIGSSFSNLVDMKDLVRGNVSSALTGQPTQIVTNLVTGDAITFLDPTYTIPGQYCIRQSLPYPASVLGVFPRYVLGDDR